MYFNYNFYWVFGHAINYNFAQVILILITFLITFLHSLLLFKKVGSARLGSREWYTPYQSEDPSPIIPTYRQKEEKGKESRRL